MMMVTSAQWSGSLLLLVIGAAMLEQAVAEGVCHSVGMDVGGNQNSCGYAPEVLVVGPPGYNFSRHSWIASKGIQTKEAPLETWEHCQKHCAEFGPCAFFAMDTADGHCVLKGPYPAGQTCEPLYQEKVDAISGPNVCPDCFMENYDYKSQVATCGYAREMMVYGPPGYDFSAHSWIADKGIPTEHVASAEELEYSIDCQNLCLVKKDLGCGHFSFNKDTKMCILKEKYNGTCSPEYTGASASLTSGPVVCPNCLADGYDIAAPPNRCGYAAELIMYGGPGYNFSKHSWLATKGIESKHVELETDLDSAMDCRALCAKTPNCAYFVYDAPNQGIGHCMLKAAYPSQLCQPLYSVKTETDISGLMACPSVGGEMTTCQNLKDHYKAQKCCGMPSKEVPKM